MFEAAQLADRFRERLRVMATRRLGDPSLAEDAAQETLARVLEALEQGRVERLDALPAFVYQTARHVCQQWERKRNRGRRAAAALAHETRQGAGEAALWRLVSEERRAEVRRALERLSTSDRELLRLLFFEAVDAAAAADRLGIGRGALRVRKHRALRRLEMVLREEL